MELYHGDYHDRTTDSSKLRQVVELTAPKIKEFMATTSITHIVATGMSGMAAAFPLSVATGLPVAVVRRHHESGQHTDGILGVVGSGNLRDFIVVDDFTSSGTTMHYVLARINKAWELYGRDNGTRPLCRGIFLYSSRPDLGRTFKPDLKSRVPSEFASDFKYPFDIPVIGTRQQ